MIVYTIIKESTEGAYTHEIIGIISDKDLAYAKYAELSSAKKKKEAYSLQIHKITP